MAIPGTDPIRNPTQATTEATQTRQVTPTRRETPSDGVVDPSSTTRADAQADTVRQSFDDPQQATSILDRDFIVFDTAAHGGDADDKVSLEDVEAVARGGTLPDGTQVSAEQQAAAQYLVDNPEAFATLDIADDSSGVPDQIISRGDVDKAVEAGPEIFSAVDQEQVDFALGTIRSDLPMNQSALADALRNPLLNEAERNLIIQTLARDGDEFAQLPFFANDASRFRTEDYAALAEDQRVIAEAIQTAYDAGAINADDLLRIADANGADNGAQRFLSILTQSSEARQPGGVAEVLADALWARNGNDGVDRAVAAMHYSSDPTLMADNLDTPEKRVEAFEALVRFNESNPYEDIPDGPAKTLWETSALAGAGRLFTAHSQELIDHYTSGEPGRFGDTGTLAQFMGQTLFNPDARGIALDRRRDLVPAIRDALTNAGETFFDRVRDPQASATDQNRAMRQFGQLTASISAGAAVALTAYDEQILANEASRQQFANLLGTVVGKLPLGDAAGEVANRVSGPLAERIYDALNEEPERPDLAVALELRNSYESQVDLLNEELENPDLINAFESAYGAEIDDLQLELNVNLGGHQE